MTTINSTTVRRFNGVMKNQKPISIELAKTEGILNRVKVESSSDNRVLYNYANNPGLDLAFFKDKIGSFCEQIKDGAKLFKEIMEWGLKNPK